MYGVLLVPFPQDLVTHVSKQPKNRNFQTFNFVMKMKASDDENQNQVKLSARAQTSFNTSLLSEDGERFLKMEGEEGVTPTYIYSAIVIWHNIML